MIKTMKLRDLVKEFGAGDFFEKVIKWTDEKDIDTVDVLNLISDSFYNDINFKPIDGGIVLFLEGHEIPLDTEKTI
jgi:hypothetical protein